MTYIPFGDTITNQETQQHYVACLHDLLAEVGRWISSDDFTFITGEASDEASTISESEAS